jgi:hypothetical protein
MNQCKKVKAVASYGSLGYELNQRVTVVKQSSGKDTRDYGQMIIGIIQPDGTMLGYVPTRQVPYYVAK